MNYCNSTNDEPQCKHVKLKCEVSIPNQLSHGNEMRGWTNSTTHHMESESHWNTRFQLVRYVSIQGFQVIR